MTRLVLIALIAISLDGCALFRTDCVNSGLIAGERVFIANPVNQVATIETIRGPSSSCKDPRYPIQADLIR